MSARIIRNGNTNDDANSDADEHEDDDARNDDDNIELVAQVVIMKTKTIIKVILVMLKKMKLIMLPIICHYTVQVQCLKVNMILMNR